ncbi:uncharacterized protein N7511_009932 [Penicillium nucicola]|uniref:uncharacterized protein n=1 Tax=Penicillium nucicola TaxID=1850975 RepID=UPI002544F106|nr:uncharacterized protein N7511_009932 [Penicillium nucicola]KAJ5748236.1 hypothetical protein N7511_009932 [Penicillium nucicola]
MILTRKNGRLKDENEDLEYQRDIEEHEYTTSGDTTQTLKIRLYLVDETVGDWMKSFVAECTCDGVDVARAVARYIDRERMRSRFWENMEEPSEETCDVAFHVFDRYGRVNLKYRDHPVQNGTGIWGSELDNGPLFLIEILHIKDLELRRKGLGQKVVSLLLNKVENFCLGKKEDHRKRFRDMLRDEKFAKLCDIFDEDFEKSWNPHALVIPGILTDDIKSQLEGKSTEERLIIKSRVESGTIDFWRACGFRRIGASRCFAFSFDFQHQSRALSAASDFDPRRSHAKDLEYEELEVAYEADHFIERNKLKLERLRAILPLHHSALTLTDE